MKCEASDDALQRRRNVGSGVGVSSRCCSQVGSFGQRHLLQTTSKAAHAHQDVHSSFQVPSKRRGPSPDVLDYRGSAPILQHARHAAATRALRFNLADLVYQRRSTSLSEAAIRALWFHLRLQLRSTSSFYPSMEFWRSPVFCSAAPCGEKASVDFQPLTLWLAACRVPLVFGVGRSPKLNGLGRWFDSTYVHIPVFASFLVSYSLRLPWSLGIVVYLYSRVTRASSSSGCIRSPTYMFSPPLAP